MPPWPTHHPMFRPLRFLRRVQTRDLRGLGELTVQAPAAGPPQASLSSGTAGPEGRADRHQARLLYFAPLLFIVIQERCDMGMAIFQTKRLRLSEFKSLLQGNNTAVDGRGLKA